MDCVLVCAAASASTVETGKGWEGEEGEGMGKTVVPNAAISGYILTGASRHRL
jgi:hypothetical protein